MAMSCPEPPSNGSGKARPRSVRGKPFRHPPPCVQVASVVYPFSYLACILPSPAPLVNPICRMAKLPQGRGGGDAGRARWRLHAGRRTEFPWWAACGKIGRNACIFLDIANACGRNARPRAPVLGRWAGCRKGVPVPCLLFFRGRAEARPRGERPGRVALPRDLDLREGNVREATENLKPRQWKRWTGRPLGRKCQDSGPCASTRPPPGGGCRPAGEMSVEGVCRENGKGGGGEEYRGLPPSFALPSREGVPGHELIPVKTGSSGIIVEPPLESHECKEQEGRQAPPPSERGVARP